MTIWLLSRQYTLASPECFWGDQERIWISKDLEVVVEYVEEDEA